jgi:hypothetical protein
MGTREAMGLFTEDCPGFRVRDSGVIDYGDSYCAMEKLTSVGDMSMEEVTEFDDVLKK